MAIMLIGSRALEFYIKGTSNKSPDYDFICDSEQSANELANKIPGKFVKVVHTKKFNTNTIVIQYCTKYIEITYPLSSDCSTSKIFDFAKSETISYKVVDVHIQCLLPSLDMLYTLKMSHRYLRDTTHFMKTMQDIHKMRARYAKLVDDWFQLREKETYNYSHPKLNTTSREFFNDSVDYLYDHDSIHEAVKIASKPAYKFYLKDGQQVMCSKEKFFDLPHEIRLYGVLEESYVLALERAMIPSQFSADRKRCFVIALQKVCTSITSGWFREFAWEHYHELLSRYDNSYVDKFYDALNAGLIKPHHD